MLPVVRQGTLTLQVIPILSGEGLLTLPRQLLKSS